MISIAAIITAICAESGITEPDLISPRRAAATVRARHVAMYLARHLTGASYPQIAAAFGDRDHTSVIYAVRRIAMDLPGDAALAGRIDTVRAELAGRAGAQSSSARASQCA